MKTFFKSTMIASVAAMGLSLAACDSTAENKAEENAEAVRDSADALADKMENKADAMDTKTDGMDTPAENAMES